MLYAVFQKDGMFCYADSEAFTLDYQNHILKRSVQQQIQQPNFEMVRITGAPWLYSSL